jgi:putative YphP/YqiW family bacilliredoxin
MNKAVRARPSGTLMIVVNSVCGCAAAKARPGVSLLLQHPVRPNRVTTVFAGADIAATDRARHDCTGYQPSAPSIGLLRDGTLVFMLGRTQIENRDAQQIAEILTDAYEQFCQPIATPSGADFTIAAPPS